MTSTQIILLLLLALAVVAFIVWCCTGWPWMPDDNSSDGLH